MTGKVNKRILVRYGELIIHVLKGKVEFTHKLVRSREFLADETPFRYLDVNNVWQETIIPKSGIGFTWCQVPIVYELNTEEPVLVLTTSDGKHIKFDELTLADEYTDALFNRTGFIKKIHITLNTNQLLSD